MRLKVTLFLYRHILFLVITLLLHPVSVHASGYEITGQILAMANGNSNPVEYVRVRAVERSSANPNDDTLAESWTDDQGRFSLQFALDRTSVIVAIDVGGKAMVPDGKFIYMRNPSDKSIIIYDNVFKDVICSVGQTALAPKYLPDNKCNILTEAGKAIRYTKSHSTTMPWTVPCDLDAYAAPAILRCSCDGDNIYINARAYDAWQLSQQGHLSSIHHETGHFIAYQAYGRRWPSAEFRRDDHVYDMETCVGFAFTEGWAEFFASMSGPDWSTREDIYNSTAWRGQDLKGDDNATGVGPGMGEIVEGAIANAWVNLNKFDKTFEVIAKTKPNTFRQWLNGWITLQYDVIPVFSAAQENGILYSRGKVDGFSETAPPNSRPSGSATAVAGNQKTIRGITFLRGTVTPVVSEVAKDALKLATGSETIPCDRKKLLFKPVTTPEESMMDQLESKDSVLGKFKSMTGHVGWNEAVVFDTSSQATPDGSYDLLVQVANKYGWWDNFMPSFREDKNPSRESDEKWLKHLQTWYSQETEPTDYKKGKVIIDNTPPEIKKVFPPANNSQ